MYFILQKKKHDFSNSPNERILHTSFKLQKQIRSIILMM